MQGSLDSALFGRRGIVGQGIEDSLGVGGYTEETLVVGFAEAASVAAFLLCVLPPMLPASSSVLKNPLIGGCYLLRDS